MSPVDVGVELWALVYHLYRSRRSAADALAELTLRTRTPMCATRLTTMTAAAAAAVVVSDKTPQTPTPSHGDDDKVHRCCACCCRQHDRDADSNKTTPSQPSQLRQTAWYAAMSARYRRVRARVCAAHARDCADAASLVRELYPAGCAASDVADAVQTCVAMFAVSVPRARVQRALDACTARLAARRASVVDADELQQLLVDGLLVDTLLSPRWWTCDEDDGHDGDGDAAAQEGAGVALVVPRVTRVALRAQPAELVIEYVRASCATHHGNGNNKDDDVDHRRRRCRRVRVDAQVLASGAPVATLARQLATSHEVLLPEAALQQQLLKLQRLLRTASTNTASQGRHGAAHDTLQHVKSSTNAAAAAAAGAPSSSFSWQAYEASSDASPHNNNDDDDTATSSQQQSSHSGNNKATHGARKADVGLLYRDPAAALDNVDLNDADELTLREYKAAMDVAFSARALRPGDAGYVYDKRVDVAPPTQRSEWDDDDDDE